MLIYSKVIKNSGMKAVFITSKFFSVVWHLLLKCKIEETGQITTRAREIA